MAKVLAAFEQARQAACGPLERYYQIGNLPMQLRFANPALVALLTPALAHLAATRTATPGLTVCLWDSASSGVALPPLPAAWQQAYSRPHMWGIHAHTATFHAFLQPAHQVLSLFDKTRNLAIYWTQDAQQLPIYEGGAPLLLLLHWWLGQQQLQVVHGAAVGTVAGAVLLVGNSGAGKSTTALRCLNDEMLYLGDDYCLLAGEDPPRVHSLYSSGKVHLADLDRFPRLQAALNDAPYAYADKKLYFLHESFGGQIAQQLPLRAILLPKRTGERATRLQPASAADALLAVAPSTTFQLPGANTQTIHQLSQVLRRLPCYWLELGTDLAQIPKAITRLLAP